MTRRPFASATLALAGLVLWAASVPLIDSEGLRCEDYANPHWQGPAVRARVLLDPTAPLLGATSFAPTEPFSTQCDGWLFVTSPGNATFLLESDDGSDLVISGQLVVANLGHHGPTPARGTSAVMPGSQPLRVRYSQEEGDREFSWLWAPAGLTLRPLDAGDLSRRPLTRMEHRLRRSARLARAIAVLLVCAAFFTIGRGRFAAAFAASRRRLSSAHAAIVTDSRRAVLLLVAIAAAVRIALTFVTQPIVWPDSHVYYEMAQSILRGDWALHEIFRTPGFSAFMAMFLAADDTPLSGYRLIAAQRVLGVLGAVVVYAIGREAFRPATAFYGTLLWTVSPLQLYYETAVSSEAVFVFVLLGTLLAAVRLLNSRYAAAFAIVGALCAAAVLTRPVAKGLIVVVILAGAIAGSRSRRSFAQYAMALCVYLVCIVPWMYANSQTYGFFGISRGEGLGLFMRAFDIERLPPPGETRYADVSAAYRQLAANVPYVHYRIRDELNYRRGYSARETDDAMEAYALEAIAAHPIAFVAGVVFDWGSLFVAPHRSVDTCLYPSGPVLCAARNAGDSLPAFPNAPPSGYAPLKRLVADYMDLAYWVTPGLAPLALIGMLLSRGPRHQRFARALLVATIVYFSLVSVSFNTFEDRYRLPIDSLVLLFAVECITMLFTGRSAHHGMTPSSWKTETAA